MHRLRLFGGIELQDADGGAVSVVLAQPKRLALLVYLAAGATGFTRRDTLLALFWPDLDAPHARDALNSAIRFLRRALGDATIVSRGADELGVEPMRLWCDAALFRAHAYAGRFDDAIELYRGDLLPGFYSDNSRQFEEWLDGERTRLRSTAAQAARALANSLEREGDVAAAVAMARRAVELSDVDERVVRELLELLDRHGDRGGAIRAYEVFARRLACELETEPAAETTALVERIRTRHPPPTVVAPGTDSGDTAGDAWPSPPAPISDNRQLTTPPLDGGTFARSSRVLRAPRLALIGGAFGILSILGYAVARPTPREGAFSIVNTTKLTNSPGLELDPAISPDGKAIAYAAGTPGRMRIHVRQLAGGRSVEVSGESMRLHRWPVWSPDGSELAFVASDGDRGQRAGLVFVVPAFGGGERLVGEGRSFSATPAWSPDGRHIAWPTADSIIVVGLRDQTRRAIHGRPDMNSLAWSHDGTRLAFVSGNSAYSFGTTAFGNLSPSAIWTMALDGSPPQRITRGAHVFLSPVWTPDDRGMLYLSNAAGAFDAYHVDLDARGHPGAEPRRLTTGLDAHGVSLSPDGSRLAYSVLHIRSNVFAAPISAADSTPAAWIHPLTDENATIETADISHDGAWLVFDSNRGGRSHIYKVPVTGGEPVQLTRDAFDDFAPTWSPDGRRIAFHSRRSRHDARDVFVMNAEGGELAQVSTDTLDDRVPDWAPDGRSLHFMRPSAFRMTSRLRDDGQWTPPATDSTLPATARWTTDGRYLVFHRQGTLYTRPRGGAPRLLATSSQLGGRITTTAMGKDPAVVFVRVIDSIGVHAFYSIPVAGGSPRLVMRLEETSRQPARVIFSTDGRRLVFTLTEAESDVWVATLRKP